MRQIAIYGKGGAGKSTIASNLSHVLASRGAKVLQIGCDPKHDSTRILLNGARLTTAVELFQKNRPEKITLEELVFISGTGIECIEVGGPEPGAGCAGLGIIKTLELVKSLNLLERGYDYVFFDVLGDVVCGGFATPLRLKFADEVYIVVSGEMMSLYAANNICRGVLRYVKTGKVRLGGLIGNQRSAGVSMDIVERFAEKIGTQVLFTFPWSPELLEAEKRSLPLLEHAPESGPAALFMELADRLANNTQLVIPTPMSGDEFENFYREFHRLP